VRKEEEKERREGSDAGSPVVVTENDKVIRNKQ